MTRNYSSKWIKVSQPFPNIPVLHAELARWISFKVIYLMIQNMTSFFFAIWKEVQLTHSHLNSWKRMENSLILWQKTDTTYVHSSYHLRFQRFLQLDWIVRGFALAPPPPSSSLILDTMCFPLFLYIDYIFQKNSTWSHYIRRWWERQQQFYF